MTDRDPSAPLNYITRQESELKFYSLGLAANNKKVDSNTLYVTPIESVMMQNGELISKPFDQEAEGWDIDDKKYTTLVNTDTALECDWMGETNRRTSPDVRRGERVKIYRFADRDEYQWESLGLDDHLRKLETYVFGISGTPDEKKRGTDLDKGYFMEFSSHKGAITIWTSKENGEFTTYAIQIDAKNGRYTVSDALGNNFHINSKDTIVEMENADGTLVQLNKQDIIVRAPRNIDVKAGNNIEVQAGKNIVIKADNAGKFEAGANLVLKAGGKVMVEGQAQFLDEVKMDAKLTATGIESSAPIVGPTDTI